MKTHYNVITLLLAFLITSCSLYAQKIDNGVIKITSHLIKDNQQSKSFGAGIIIDQLGNRIYLMSALHVIIPDHSDPNGEGYTLEDIEFIEFTFPKSGETIKCKLSEIRNKTSYADDFVMLSFKVPFNFVIDSKKYRKGDFNKILKKRKKQKEVGIISSGYPNQVAEVKSNNNAIDDIERDRFTYETSSIGKGHSGGIVQSKKGKKILGINLSKGGNTATVLRIDKIEYLLEKWGAPHSFIKKEGLKTSTIIWGSAGLLKIGAGAFFHFKQNQTYTNYKTYLDPKGHEKETGRTRQEGLDKAKDFEKFKFAGYIAGGLCGLAAYLDFKNKKKKAKYGANPSFGSTDLLKNNIHLHSSGNDIGIVFNF